MIDLNEQNYDSNKLKQKAGRGASWKLFNGFVNMFVRLGASIVLARLLFPSDFGIVGMALIVQNFIQQIGTLGMGAGVVAKKEITQDDLSTVFWTDAASRLIMFLVLYLGAPFAALFFETPELTDVLKFTSLFILVSIVGSVQGVILSRRLDFRAQVVIGIIATILNSSLAILFALVFSWGYWSLVVSNFIANVFTAIARFLYVRWLPSLTFNKKSFRYMFRYGINGLGTSAAGYLFQNIDYLVVGKILGPSSLGFYEYAYRIPHMLHEKISKPVSGVIFPVLSKVQSNNRILVSGYAKAARYISILTFPLLIGLCALAEPFVELMWGIKWMSIVWPMRILCILTMFRCVFGGLHSIYMCKDRPDIPFKIKVVRTVIAFVCVASLGSIYGINGVALGMLFSAFPVFFEVWLVGRMTQSTMRDLLGGLFAPLLSSVLCGIAAFFVFKILLHANYPLWLQLVTGILSGAIVYILSAFLLFKDYTNQAIEELFLIFKKAIP